MHELHSFITATWSQTRPGNTLVLIISGVTHTCAILVQGKTPDYHKQVPYTETIRVSCDATQIWVLEHTQKTAYM